MMMQYRKEHSTGMCTSVVKRTIKKLSEIR